MNVPVSTMQITEYGDAAHATITTALREKLSIARERRDSANFCIEQICRGIQILNRIALDHKREGESHHSIALHGNGEILFVEVDTVNGLYIHSSDSLNDCFPVEAAKEWLKEHPENLSEKDYFLLEGIDQWNIKSFNDCDLDTITFTKAELVKLFRTAQDIGYMNKAEDTEKAFNAAIEFTLNEDAFDGHEFLRDWKHDEWERIARNWPEFDLTTTGDKLAIEIADRVKAERQAAIRAEEMRDE